MTNRRIAALTAGILSASAILPYLLDLGYRPLDGEVLILTVLASVIGGALGFALAPVTKAYHALLGVIVYWIADCYFVNSENLLLLAVAAGATVYLVMGTRYRMNLQPMLLTFGVFWIISNLLSPAREFINPPLPGVAEAGNSLPPIIHVILDEQASPEALPETVPGNGHPAGRMVQTLADSGFEVYPNVMSASDHTRFSLANLFSRTGSADNFGAGSGQFTLAIKNNDILAQLTDAGYRVTVIQSNYLDICADAKDVSCHTYNRAGSGHAFATRSSDLGLRTRLALIELHAYLHGSQVFGGVFVYNLAARLMRHAGLPMNETVYYSRPPALIDLIASLKPRFENIKSGEAYVMHLVVPHSPFVLRSDCSVNDPRNFAQRAGEDVVPKTEADIYPLYWDQSACTIRTLLTALDGLKASPAGKDAIVMIHGDHGARITIGNEHAHDEKDMLQTLFAIRRGSSPGAVNRDPKILQDLFRQQVAQILAPSNKQVSQALPELRKGIYGN